MRGQALEIDVLILNPTAPCYPKYINVDNELVIGYRNSILLNWLNMVPDILVIRPLLIIIIITNFYSANIN